MDDETLSPSFFTEAADLDTSPTRLAELARYTALHLHLAANPATPPHTLAQLSEASDPAIRRTVAQNPNASVQTLGHLAGEFPQEFLHNPIIPILNMTRPSFIKELPFITWASLLRFEKPPKSWLQQIKTDKTYQRNQPAIWKLVQLHITHMGETSQSWKTDAGSELKSHQQNPPQLAPLDSADEMVTLLLFALLFPQCVPMLREQWLHAARTSPRLTGIALSASMAMGSQTMNLLAFEHNTFMLCQVARHSRTSTKTLAKLAAHRLPQVRCAVASNPHTPLENIYTLVSENNSTVRRAAVSHPALTSEDYEILALDRDESVRAALATVSKLDPALLTQLASDPAATVRAAVARNVRVAPEMLLALAHDPSPTVRAAAAGNPCLPGEIESLLLTDPEASVRAHLSGNARLSEQSYIQLAQDASPTVRKYLAANPRTPTRLLTVLWPTEDREVWSGIARHPLVSPEILAQLAQQGDIRVRAAVAAHKHTPIEVLYILAQENTREIWSSLASNPHTPLDLLEQALTTPYTELWYRLINHPTIVRNQRRPFLTLLTSKLPQLIATNRLPNWLRRAIFQYYTALPSTMLEPFAHSPYWEERYLAARHPQIEASVLDMLAQDGICYVRAAAWDALQRHNHSGA